MGHGTQVFLPEALSTTCVHPEFQQITCQSPSAEYRGRDERENEMEGLLPQSREDDRVQCMKPMWMSVTYACTSPVSLDTSRSNMPLMFATFVSHGIQMELFTLNSL